MAMAHRGPAENDAAVSVILPNYNHGRFLDRCVRALLTQEHCPGEIIIIDDGSTDDSGDIIDRLARDASCIRVLRNAQNLGIVPAQQRGLAEATCPYVYLAGADDWVMPSFFALAIRLLGQYREAGFFSGDSVLIDGASGRPLGFRPVVAPRFRAGFVDPSEMRQLLARGDHHIVTGGALFERQAVLAAGGLDQELGSFADGFLARKIALMRGFCYAPTVVSAWRIVPTGISRRSALDLNNARRMLDVARRKLEADPVFPDWYAACFADRWRFATSRLVLKESPAEFAFVPEMAARNALDRGVLNAVWRLSKGPIGRTAVLFWLWLRLRPYRLRDLITTAIVRKVALRRAITRGGLQQARPPAA
jgi:glycosyltransferase involved in cell wall biosynthesis